MYYENEKEWLKMIEEERNELDRNQKITNARLEGEAIGEARGNEETMNKNIQSMYKNGCDSEFIARVLEQDIEYIEQIIKSNLHDKVQKPCFSF